MDKYKKSLDNIIHNKQIKTVFQPIISLKGGFVMGYEALSRITCESEFENPEIMFTAATEHNRLWDLELLCRAKALEAAHEFMVPPYSKKLFINVNPNIIYDETFKTGFTQEFLRQYKIIPNNVTFEITERNVINDMVSFKSTITHYKNQDYKIAIDDAGAGFSGLNLITDVNPHYIKLDMKLIRNINADNLKSALVKGMVEFSKVSNVQIIAEGIETYKELETVINLGVQYGQGYYIQKPNEKILTINQDVIQSIQEINTKKSRMVCTDVYHSSIKYLCASTGTITSNESVLNAYNSMKQDPNCFGLCIVDNNIPLGIITKEKLSFALSGQYGFTLYHNKPISVIMDREFLAVESKTPIDIVSSLAMARTNDNLYDFIVVTEDKKYSGTVTVKDLLQKALELEVLTAKQQNPLTELPGNLKIEQKLNENIDNGCDFSVSYLDIDNFKAYNDVYGFESGDLIIKLLADILRESIPADQFIGHIGGDDFIVIMDGHKTEEYFKDIIVKFESEVLAFYNQSDIENGYIIAKSRHGIVEKFPLIKITVVSINNEAHVYTSASEMSAILAGLKNSAKQRKIASNISEKGELKSEADLENKQTGSGLGDEEHPTLE